MNSIMLRYSYIPLMYWLSTRLIKKGQFLEWFFHYILVPCLFIYSVSEDKDVWALVYYLLGVLLVLNVYEIGYLDNDLQAKHEKKGSKDRLGNIKIHFLSFSVVRVFISICFFLGVSNVDLGFMLGLPVMFFLYLIHNRSSIRYRVFSYYFLSLLRYFLPYLCIKDLYTSGVGESLSLILIIGYFFTIQPKVVTYILRKAELIKLNWVVRYINIFSLLIIKMYLLFYGFYILVFLFFLISVKEVIKIESSNLH